MVGSLPFWTWGATVLVKVIIVSPSRTTRTESRIVCIDCDSVLIDILYWRISEWMFKSDWGKITHDSILDYYKMTSRNIENWLYVYTDKVFMCQRVCWKQKDDKKYRFLWYFRSKFTILGNIILVIAFYAESTLMCLREIYTDDHYSLRKCPLMMTVSWRRYTGHKCFWSN